MRKMILVRHGKSSWADPDTPDHDRPLAPRGSAASLIIADWLRTRGHHPDTVLCSSSLRTRQTLERMRLELPDLPEAAVEEGLYHASPQALLARLQALPDDCVAVMVVGHQPGLGSFVRKMSNGEVRPRCARAFDHFPTAAAAVLTHGGADWSEIGFGKAAFVDFAKPRELVPD